MYNFLMIYQALASDYFIRYSNVSFENEAYTYIKYNCVCAAPQNRQSVESMQVLKS